MMIRRKFVQGWPFANMVLFGATELDCSFCGECVVLGRWRSLDRNGTYRLGKCV